MITLLLEALSFWNAITLLSAVRMYGAGRGASLHAYWTCGCDCGHILLMAGVPKTQELYIVLMDRRALGPVNL